ncbi:MAG: hypothetical protein ACE5JB_14050 [bacterium]
MTSFSESMKEKPKLIWQAILNHPFVKGIGDGTLAMDKYEFYLKQVIVITFLTPYFSKIYFTPK